MPRRIFRRPPSLAQIVPRLHELCKLVENMAAAPCADQYFDIFNRHTALLAKIEELEPSPDVRPTSPGSSKPRSPCRYPIRSLFRTRRPARCCPTLSAASTSRPRLSMSTATFRVLAHYLKSI